MIQLEILGMIYEAFKLHRSFSTVNEKGAEIFQAIKQKMLS